MTTTLRKQHVKRFSPAGLSDSLDATDEYPGACAILQDLIIDPSTRNLWTPRPASQLIADLALQFTSPLANGIPIIKVVGQYVFGLYSAADGKDHPWAYNLLTSAFVAVTGTGQNPTSQPATGGWTPPVMAVCGTNLVVTHPGFDGTSNFFGWFDISTFSAPVWHSGNTAPGSVITFTNIPSWVAQFNGRAFFGINPPGGQPSVVMTDSLTLKVTNAGQVLTFGDNAPLTCAFSMPLSNQLGGIIQSLMVFKDSSNIAQVTGDYSLSNLAVNTLNVATGTQSPRGICSTPIGMAFVSPLGVRIIDKDANVSAPIGAFGKGVSLPFIAAVTPTRISSACDGNTIRFGFQSGLLAGNPFVEYWYNIPLQMWSGPHTFCGSCHDVFEDLFVVVSQSHPTQLFYGPTIPTSTTGTTEFGTTLQWVMQSCMLEDNQQMSFSELQELQVVCGGGTVSPNILNVALQDSNAQVINSTIFTITAGSSLWGTMQWGSGIWGGPQGIYPYRVDFQNPSVFNRAAIRVTGVSSNGFRIGDIYMRMADLGYMGQ